MTTRLVLRSLQEYFLLGFYLTSQYIFLLHILLLFAVYLYHCLSKSFYYAIKKHQEKRSLQKVFDTGDFSPILQIKLFHDFTIP